MTLNKAIKHGKEKRKPYYGSARFDRSCRCHGGCGYCEDNRLRSRRKAELEARQEIEDFKKTLDDPEEDLWLDLTYQEFFEDPYYYRFIDYEEEKEENESKVSSR